MNALCEDTGNVYETVKIIAKRSNQISVEMKSELEKKLQEFKFILIIWKKFLKPRANRDFKVL